MAHGLDEDLEEGTLASPGLVRAASDLRDPQRVPALAPVQDPDFAAVQECDAVVVEAVDPQFPALGVRQADSVEGQALVLPEILEGEGLGRADRRPEELAKARAA